MKSYEAIVNEVRARRKALGKKEVRRSLKSFAVCDHLIEDTQDPQSPGFALYSYPCMTLISQVNN